MSATLTHGRPVPLPRTLPDAGAYTDSSDPFLFRRFRTWWLLIALFLMAQGNGILNRQDDRYWSLKRVSHLTQSSPIYLLLTVILWFMCASLIFGHLRPALQMMVRQRVVLAFAVLALISTLWSQDPNLTFRKAMLLFLTFLFAWFFATYYSPADQMRILIAAGVIIALASCAMAILLPQYGIASTGEWKGVFGQKNRLGLGIFFLFSALPFCSLSSYRKRISLALQALLPVGLILLSQSRTSLIMALVLVAIRIIGPLIARARRDQLPFMWYSVVSGTLFVGFAISLGSSLLLTTLGRDATLSGRTEHWPLLLSFAFRHLWLGYGYEAFWTGTGDSLTVIRSVGAAMRGADSGYMDTMLQFGLTGIGLLLVLLLLRIRDFARLLRRPTVPLIAYWYLGIILATFVGSYTEILFLTSNGIITFIFVIACAGLTRLQQPEAWVRS